MIIQRNIQLQQYNSFGTMAIAKLFCEPQNQEELAEILKAFPNEKKLVLGAGFNLFFTRDFDGLVIKPGMKDINVIFENDDYIEIEAGAAVDWDTFVEMCVYKRYSGVENLSLIPSSVGASPIQNIGAYGTEAKDTIVLVKAVDKVTGEQKEFKIEECEFGYRDSIFKRTCRYIITSVIFRLSKTFVYKDKYIDLSRELNGVESPTLTQVRDAIVKIRTRKLPDPSVLPNAGSFFKNPVLTKEEKDNLEKKFVDVPIYNVGENSFKTSAAYLIEKAGYKGKRHSMVGTYEHHALVIVNYGTPNGKDIADFAAEIQGAVLKQFDIQLEPEVWIL